MEKEQFFDTVARQVRENLGEEYQVSVKQITKNNQVVLNGLVISREKVNISPTIYLDAFWQSYRWGMSLEAIVEKILEVYEREAPKENIPMDFFKNFDKVRDRICYKLVNYEENEELLKEIPHFQFLDMAVCFYYSYFEEKIGKGSILIHNSHLELWKTDKEALKELAKANTPRIFPADFCSMETILMNVYGDQEEDRQEESFEEIEELSEIPMYVLTNTARIFGAAVIMYEDVLKKIADRLQCSLLIIPSSVHEVILLKDDGETEGENIKKMIREVNETQVEPEERLSDSLYRYDREEGKVSILL